MCPIHIIWHTLQVQFYWRWIQQHISSLHRILCLPFQQTQPVVHKLLGACMYDSRAKRPKLKPTDRRPVVNVTATSNDESAGDSGVKPLQTIDDMRKMRNRQMQAAQRVVKPYVSKRTTTAAVEDDYQQHINRKSEQCYAHPSVASTATNCITSTTSGHDVHSSNRSSIVTVQKCEEYEQSSSADSCRFPQEKLMKYVNAIG